MMSTRAFSYCLFLFILLFTSIILYLFFHFITNIISPLCEGEKKIGGSIV